MAATNSDGNIMYDCGDKIYLPTLEALLFTCLAIIFDVATVSTIKYEPVLIHVQNVHRVI